VAGREAFISYELKGKLNSNQEQLYLKRLRSKSKDIIDDKDCVGGGRETGFVLGVNTAH
jgi:hypothetical protein